MRRVLVLSPHFPPTDAVDMHRVRTAVGHYREHGWEPVVLAVRPAETGRMIDPALSRTVPDHVRRVEVGALPARLASAAGLSAIGLRAWPSLRAAGRRLLAEERFDLVFISSTAFPLMSLGRVWKRHAGTPFVLDFQDPWATFPLSATPYLRRGLKHGLMRGLHRRLEGWTVPQADGLMAVDQSYLDLLSRAYPALSGRPQLACPFGYASQDLVLAEDEGHAPWPPLESPNLSCYFAGRIAPAMQGSVAAFFEGLRQALDLQPELCGRLRVRFIGTGYQKGGNPPVVARSAANCGLQDVVEERPDRIPMLDALKGALAADVILVFGSTDDAYVPSKLHQCLAMSKPVICVAPSSSPLATAAAGFEGVFILNTDQDNHDQLGAWLEAVGSRKATTDFTPRLHAVRRFEAKASAARHCAFFEQVVSGPSASRLAA